MLYLLCPTVRHEDWKFFFILMMDKYGTAMLKPDEVEIKLLRKVATIQCEKSLG